MSDAVIIVQAVQLTPQERSLRRSPWPSIASAYSLQWFAIALVPFLPLAYLVATVDLPLQDTLIAIALIVLGLVAALMLASNVMTTMVRETGRTPTGLEANDWRIDADTVQFGSSSCKSTLKWRALVGVQETPAVFHFIISPIQVFALPKRCLNESEVDLLRSFVESARHRGDLKGVPRG